MTGLSPIAAEIWNDKYRYKSNNGEPIDLTVDQTWARVANGLAEAEAPSKRDHWAGEFYDVLRTFEFLPAGRIISGTGTGRSVTLINCYAMPSAVLNSYARWRNSVIGTRNCCVSNRMVIGSARTEHVNTNGPSSSNERLWLRHDLPERNPLHNDSLLPVWRAQTC